MVEYTVTLLIINQNTGRPEPKVKVVVKDPDGDSQIYNTTDTGKLPIANEKEDYEVNLSRTGFPSYTHLIKWDADKEVTLWMYPLVPEKHPIDMSLPYTYIEGVGDKPSRVWQYFLLHWYVYNHTGPVGSNMLVTPEQWAIITTKDEPYMNVKFVEETENFVEVHPYIIVCPGSKNPVFGRMINTGDAATTADFWAKWKDGKTFAKITTPSIAPGATYDFTYEFDTPDTPPGPYDCSFFVGKYPDGISQEFVQPAIRVVDSSPNIKVDSSEITFPEQLERGKTYKITVPLEVLDYDCGEDTTQDIWILLDDDAFYDESPSDLTLFDPAIFELMEKYIIGSSETQVLSSGDKVDAILEFTIPNDTSLGKHSFKIFLGKRDNYYTRSVGIGPIHPGFEADVIEAVPEPEKFELTIITNIKDTTERVAYVDFEVFKGEELWSGSFSKKGEFVLSGKTDINGEAVVELPPEHYLVIFDEPPTYSVSALQIEIIDIPETLMADMILKEVTLDEYLLTITVQQDPEEKGDWQPLPNARVELPEDSVLTATNGEALFDVKAGDYTVVVSADDFETQEDTVTIKDKDKTLLIQMDVGDSEKTEKRTYEIHVKDSVTGDPVVMATATAAGQSQITDSEGKAYFLMDVDTPFTLEIFKSPTYVIFREEKTIYSNKIETIEMVPTDAEEPEEEYVRVGWHVTNKDTGEDIVDQYVIVTIHGDPLGQMDKRTNGEGNVFFNLDKGVTYDVEVTRDGFHDHQSSITVTVSKMIGIELVPEEGEEPEEDPEEGEITAELSSLEVYYDELFHGHGEQRQLVDFKIKNTSSTEHTFAIGMSIVDPAIDEPDANWKKITLAAGEEKAAFLVVNLVATAPMGEYKLDVVAWKGWDGGTPGEQNDFSGGTLKDELDRESITFNVVEAATITPGTDEEESAKLTHINDENLPATEWEENSPWFQLLMRHSGWDRAIQGIKDRGWSVADLFFDSWTKVLFNKDVDGTDAEPSEFDKACVAMDMILAGPFPIVNLTKNIGTKGLRFTDNAVEGVLRYVNNFLGTSYTKTALTIPESHLMDIAKYAGKTDSEIAAILEIAPLLTRGNAEAIAYRAFTDFDVGLGRLFTEAGFAVKPAFHTTSSGWTASMGQKVITKGAGLLNKIKTTWTDMPGWLKVWFVLDNCLFLFWVLREKGILPPGWQDQHDKAYWAAKNSIEALDKDPESESARTSVDAAMDKLKELQEYIGLNPLPSEAANIALNDILYIFGVGLGNIDEESKAGAQLSIDSLQALLDVTAPELEPKLPVEEEFTALIREIIDGDGARIFYEDKEGIMQSDSIRVVGINAPEMAKSVKEGGTITYYPEEFGARESKEWLGKQINGKDVTLFVDPDNQRGRYSRILALIKLGDLNINLESLRAGWSFYYPYADNKYVDEEEFKAAQEEAKAAKRGIWSGGYGKIKITSSPPHAQIFINGEDQSKQTSETVELSPGDYEIRVELEDYLPKKQSITLESEDYKEIHFKLEKVTDEAKISLNTVPTKARIFLNDKDLNLLTPHTIILKESDLGGTDGTVNVRLEKDDYEHWESDVFIRLGEKKEFEIILEEIDRKKGKIKITSKPPGASIIPYGVPITGKLTPETLEYGCGKEWKIRLELEGYADFTFDNVWVPCDETVEIHANLEEAPTIGKAKIVSSPPYADILVNDEKVGITNKTIELVPGTYTIILRKVGYADHVFSNVVIEVGHQKDFFAKLETEAKTTGEIMAMSTPSYANILMKDPDGIGKNVGYTPQLIKEIGPETYELTFSRNGYLSSTKLVRVDAGITREVFVELEKIEVPEEKKSGINFKSSPSNAKIFINTKDSGFTTNKKVDLGPGTYKIKITFPKFEEYETGFTVEEGVFKDFYVKLEPLTEEIGTAKVTSKPSGAYIKVDGIDISRVTSSTLKLVPGSHTFTVSKTGYITQERTLTVVKGAQIDVYFDLKKEEASENTGILILKSKPTNSKIKLKGSDTGKLTPETFDLDPGTYEVEISKAGYSPATETIEIVAGGKVEKYFTLGEIEGEEAEEEREEEAEEEALKTYITPADWPWTLDEISE